MGLAQRARWRRGPRALPAHGRRGPRGPGRAAPAAAPARRTFPQGRWWWIFAALGTIAIAAAPGHADPCRQVSFRIINLTWGKIRLQAIDSYGSGGARSDSLDGRTISSQGSYTTAARDLANIADGTSGNLTVIYDSVTLASGQWTTGLRQSFIDLPCLDGKIFDLEITNRK